MFKRIAKIKDTQLGFEDHGIFTATLYLDYGGSSQGAGLRMLSYSPPPEREPIGSSKGIDHLMGILSACGVDSWEKLKGRTIYAFFDNDNYNEPVKGLGPLPTEKGKDFIFDELPLWPENT